MNKLEILYEDNHIIVVVKPFNVLSQSDVTNDNDMLSIIRKYIKRTYNKPGNVYLGLVHRLDRPTKGIMVFAKTSKAASRLSEQIRTNSMNKEYILVAHGILKENGRMIDYLEKNNGFSSVVTTEEKGKYAELEYEVIDVNYEYNLSLVKVKLITGRHHQIRVQFSSRGYPLFGDNRYGLKIDNGKQLCLIEKKLEFFHPTLKEKMSFEIEYDRNMEGFDKF